jgi:hypothetical protein
VAQGVGPEFKPQYWKRKKKRERVRLGCGLCAECMSHKAEHFPSKPKTQYHQNQISKLNKTSRKLQSSASDNAMRPTWPP